MKIKIVDVKPQYDGFVVPFTVGWIIKYEVDDKDSGDLLIGFPITLLDESEKGIEEYVFRHIETQENNKSASEERSLRIESALSRLKGMVKSEK